jgi:hypothetical protein
MKEEQMKPTVLAMLPALAGACIAFGSAPAKAFEFNGPWATSASVCSQVFIKKNGAISFRQDSDQYGGGFIVEGERVRGQMQTCTINRRQVDGSVVHMIAKCADDVMASNVQFSAKIIDDNTIARIFPGIPEFTLSYSRCSM